MTIEQFKEILNWLDGRGLILTDEDLIDEALQTVKKNYGLEDEE